MITASAILKIYLQMNLLLLSSYLLFRAFRFVAGLMNSRSGYQALVRAGQCLVLACLLVPPIFSIIPQRSLPAISFRTVHPLSEGGNLRTPLRKVNPPSPANAIETRAVQEHPSLTAILLATLLKLSRGNWASSVLLLIGVGFLASFTRLLIQLGRLRALIARGLEIRRIGKVTVLASEEITVPFSTWLGARANILFPATILERAADFQIALRHEIQHHRQRDTLWALLIEGLACVFYPNPAIYLWKKEITELQEFSCDEALIGQRRVSSHDYGSCLVRVAETALGTRSVWAGTACMATGSKNPAYFKSFLRRRVEMFRAHEQSLRPRRLGILIGTASLLATMAIAYGAQQSMRTQDQLITHSTANPGHANFDPQVQAIAEQVLKASVKKYQAIGGFVLISDPRTGRLLAAANVSRGSTRQRAHWSLSYRMEPASAMKGIIAAAAIEHQVTKLDDVYNCEHGKYAYGGQTYHDWSPFDQLTTAGTVIKSSNVCGIKIGEKLGADGLARTLSEFGFGPGGTAQDFPEAQVGVVPAPGQLQSTDYIPLIATGYTETPGFYITPLEMVQAYGAIANGGKLMKPIQASEPDSAATLIRRVLSEKTAEQMKGVLADVVLRGTGANAKSAIYTTAGKTSSAYNSWDPDHSSLGGERGLAGFVGFAPVSAPRLVVYVGIIDPRSTDDHRAHGNTHAAPVFRKVVEEVLQSSGWSVPPDQKQ